MSTGRSRSGILYLCSLTQISRSQPSKTRSLRPASSSHPRCPSESHPGYRHAYAGFGEVLGTHHPQWDLVQCARLPASHRGSSWIHPWIAEDPVQVGEIVRFQQKAGSRTIHSWVGKSRNAGFYDWHESSITGYHERRSQIRGFRRSHARVRAS